MLNKKITILLFLIVSIFGVGFYVQKDKSTSRNYSGGRHTFSNIDPESYWVVINKDKPLNPLNYAPTNLVTPNLPLRSNITDQEKQVEYGTSLALEKMKQAAASENIGIDLQSGFRSYEFQKRLYGNYTEKQGQSQANSYSAKPGFSEHQTGFAVDIGGTSNPDCNVRKCFADTAEAKWLENNAHKYGFIIRYPKDKQDITGYAYEPWHFRYTGEYLAALMKSGNAQTLEEYFKDSQD